MDGRKATGGKLEVRVKIREPLSGVDVQPVTEKWLVLDPVSSLSPPERQKERVSSFQFPCGYLSLCLNGIPPENSLEKTTKKRLQPTRSGSTLMNLDVSHFCAKH